LSSLKKLGMKSQCHFCVAARDLVAALTAPF
jgi:hypothetical protein